MFENCKWIWIHNEESVDEYAEFVADFDLSDITGVKLNISVDGNFEAYLNGKLCAFGSCADYPFYKFYDSFALDEVCVLGKNNLKILVWHIGSPSSTYVKSNAGVIFEITNGEKSIVKSDESTLSRRNENYTNGLCRKITGQLGLTYRYDNTVDNNNPYQGSVVVEKSYDLNAREIENLKLLPRIPTVVDDDGKRLLIDWGKEAAGYLDLDFVSEGEQEIKIVFGEHLDDNGNVPQIIGGRDFSIDFVARDGDNVFAGFMRRIAGRYIEIAYEKPIHPRYIGIRPVVYPLNKIEKHFDNELHQRIYDASSYTLECCMHEHYEDCPWREQALYSLDSRNQMLCGYVAFEEYRYARYNILLLSKSLHNGLLRITSPTETDLPIPFFSLTFVQQVYEYVKYSGDRSIVDEVMHALQTIMETFAFSIDESGLIPAPAAPAWNFYEWTPGNDGYRASGILPKDRARYDICLNAMYLYVLPMFWELGGTIGVDADKLSKGIIEKLYDEEHGLFKNTTEDGRLSLIGNSLAILAGVGDASVAQKIVSDREKLTDITLSTNAFFYDALLKSGDTYKDYIINDIEEKYGYMLSCGATTFWETIDGWHAFGDAGSLCHGWSALPVYYFDKLKV